MMVCIAVFTRLWGICVMRCHKIIPNACVDFLICGNLLLSISILVACISAHTIETQAYLSGSKFWTALLLPTNIMQGNFTMDIYPVFIIGAILVLIGLLLSIISIIPFKEKREIKLLSSVGRGIFFSNLFSICSVIVGGSIFALNTHSWSTYSCKLWSVLLTSSDPHAGIYAMDALPLLVFFSCCLLYGMILMVYSSIKEYNKVT